jgi:hypothetical protein
MTATIWHNRATGQPITRSLTPTTTDRVRTYSSRPVTAAGPGSAARLPASTDARLDRMAGFGRLILAASTGDQEAWEDPRLGHGLLTYHLIKALLGSAAPGSRQVALYDLLAYVVREVKAKASGTVAARQEPSLRGQVDGELVWPVFISTGPLYSRPTTRAVHRSQVG